MTRVRFVCALGALALHVVSLTAAAPAAQAPAAAVGTLAIGGDVARSDAIRGFNLTADQRADLVAFLRSLTDEELLRDPRFANPRPSRSSH